ncbi:MAG: VWA domain-containing protein [Oscillospiraceae bacterium]|jgi:Ca-activated chloride channel family protein|nr:VWA domain-containing protein [Oscillospiraceae bacterium]
MVNFKRIMVGVLTAATTAALFSGCALNLGSGGSKGELTVISGSENRELEPLLTEFTAQTGIAVRMEYKGSVDIMNELKAGAAGYDAVWPANAIWAAMGDDGRLIKHEKSIMASPVVFGIKKSVAQNLGFIGRDVSVNDILAKTESGELNFAMTSATQSNSGACAYFGFLSAMLGKNTPVTSDDLKRPELQDSVKRLLSGVNRSSGSSEWLKELVVNAGSFDGLDAMVNYESLIIAANQELTALGKEPLYVIYPYDGMSYADSPLCYIDRGDEKKEEMFLQLQEFLLSDKTQKKLNDLGRRTGVVLTVDNPNLSVWNEDWGVKPDKTLSFITLPSKDVIIEALNLYQTALRKPSATVYCLDFSGSMSGDGNSQMLSALSIIFDQQAAATHMLQNSASDYTAVIAFSDVIIDVKEVYGNNQDDMRELYNWVRAISPEGGTDIYSPAVLGVEMLGELDNSYMKAVVLLTDGESNIGMSDVEFERIIRSSETATPVFSIMFGEASDNQLGKISTLTRSRTFDGRKDIISAFKQVRGYN